MGYFVSLLWLIGLGFSSISCIFGEFTLFTIGDWGERTECFDNITEKMTQMSDDLSPEFVVSVGDNFYQKGVESEYDRMWDELLEKPFEGMPPHVKVHSCLGDHDWRGNTTAQIDRTWLDSNQRWYMPGYWWYEWVEFSTNQSLSNLFDRSGLKELSLFNSFHFNASNTNSSLDSCNNDCLDDLVDNLNNFVTRNVSWNENLSYKAVMSDYNSISMANSTATFIYLDSWTLTQDPFKKTCSSYRTLQLNFLEETLKAAVSNKTDWIILITHYSIFSSGHHGPHARLAALLNPLINKYKVDYVISGHDHHFEILKPEITNTHFIVTGASSKPRSGFGTTHEFSIFKTNICSFGSITLSKDIAVFRAFTPTSNAYNYFKKSNRNERAKALANLQVPLTNDNNVTTHSPTTSNPIRVSPLINILGWTLSLTPFC